MRDIRVATVQFQPAAGDKTYNLGRVRHFVTEAARAGVEIIAFPEMCLTGYWHVRKLSPQAFGALAEKYDLSVQVGQRLLDAIDRQPSGTEIIASGTSCRHQITDLGNTRPKHMAELLAEALL